MKILSASHDKAYVMRFLMGLNENFETLRSQILMHDHFPSMSKVYSLVLQEESHKNIGQGNSTSSQSDAMAMYTNFKGNSNWNKGNGKKDKPFCTHYNMQGHTIEKCYKLHGYPPGYKPKRKAVNQVSCNSVNGTEMALVPSNQCPISKVQCEQLLAFLNSGATIGDAQSAASVSTYCIATGIEGASGSISDVVGTSAQANEANLNFNSTIMSGTNFNYFVPTLEHSIFSAKIVNRKVFSETDKVIDIGVTDHMVHSISCFTSITATLNTFVNLPNGETALVTHGGTVKISERLILTNVLCVPAFSFNLLLVSQLAKSILCCLIFFGNICFIQDLAH